MIISNQKLQAIARDLGNRLALRLANGSGVNSIRYASDSQGGQLLFLSHGGNESEGQPVILIYLQQISMVSNDIFGNPELAYTPSLSQVAYELNSAGAPIPSQTDLLTVEFELIPFGIRQQLLQIANGTAVTQSSAAAATPAIDLDNLYWPTKGV
jgi:hypothetical protein